MEPDRDAIEAIRRQFYSHGKTVTDWAREHGFDVHLVYSVLNGRSRARRGESHRIAVALGLKHVEDSALFDPNLPLGEVDQRPSGADVPKEAPMKN
jgi:gp16 family phage-associated protein